MEYMGMSVIVALISASAVIFFLFAGNKFGKKDLLMEIRGEYVVSYVESRGVFYAHVINRENLLVETMKAHNLIDLQKRVHRCYK